MQRILLQLMIGVTLTVLFLLPSAAAPPPLVLFQQKLQVEGESPGHLLGATWIRRETEPAIQDRYSAFHGDAQVTRHQPGKSSLSASLADAIARHHWLEVTGRGMPGELRVRAVQADLGVNYGIEIRAPTLAMPDGDDYTLYGRYMRQFDVQKQLLTQIEEIRRLCAQLGDADAIDFQELVGSVSRASTQRGAEIEKELADWLKTLPTLVADPRALRFVADVQVAQAETAGLPAPELLGRHFAFVLRQLQSNYLKGKDRDGLPAQLTALRGQLARLKSDRALKHYASARTHLSDALRDFSETDYALIAKEYLDDCLLTYADPADAAESTAIARHILDHLPASYPRLSSDKEVLTFLAEIKEFDQALQKLQAQTQNKRAFSKLDMERQELAAKFIFLHRANRPTLRDQLTALRQQAKLP